MSPHQPLTFYKMQSLGNDFLVLDGVTRNAEPDPDQVRRWSDRHTGVGFDQLLIIAPPTDPEADFWYRIFNADGSEAQQCGNGTRCVALLALELGLTRKHQLTWQSPAGMFETRYEDPDHIETRMTVPVLDLARIPFLPDGCEAANGSTQTFELGGADGHYAVTPVSMGNPHGVMFMEDIFDADVGAIGAELTRHPAFPEQANIGFCQVIDRQFMRLRVYERGVGETRACGSGACAAVVAARLHDKVDEKVKVSLPGGKLRIAWPGVGHPVTMSGAAALVFRGELAQGA